MDDTRAAARSELAACGVRFAPGSRVAIAIGSRGIANLGAIVQEIVGWVRDQGAEPLLVPAMGSHGGATAEGQEHVLAGLAISERLVGAPVRSSMDVVDLPRGDLPVPVYFDRTAAEADCTIVVNRIKPHTSFHGDHESGLLKMIAVGLGKHEGALAIHRLGLTGLREVMPRVAIESLRHNNVVLAVALVENGRDETMLLQAIRKSEIVAADARLLQLARSMMPALPSGLIDLLVVDEMGKDISGLGMDTNIIGRLRIPGEPEPDCPKIKIVLARDLTDATQGNACGIGLADITTRRLIEKVDWRATYENALTSGFHERVRIPLVAENDLEALEFAFRVYGMPDPEKSRIVRIKNTLSLENVWVSSALLDEVRKKNWRVLDPVDPVFSSYSSNHLATL